MADYNPQQQAFIGQMNSVDAQHRAEARARNRANAPRVKSGKRQPLSGSTKKITKRTRTVTKAPQAPAAPAPVSPDQALLNAAVRLRYGPQEQAINQQLGQNARFTSGLGDWYSNALNEIKGLQAQGNQQAQQTLGAVQNYNSTAAIDTPTDQQAAAARNQLNSQYGAMLGRDSNANSAAMDRLAAAFLTQQGNTRNTANSERQNILGTLANLQGQKGDFKIQYGAQLSQAQQKAANDQASLDIKTKTLQYLTGNAKAGQKKTAAQTATEKANLKFFQQHGYYPDKGKPKGPSATEQINEAKLAFFNKHGYWPPTGPPKSPKGAGSNSTYSKSKIQGFRSTWDFALEKARQLNKAGSYRKNGKVHTIDVNAAYGGLLDATKDPDIAKAAAYVAFGKVIPEDLRHRLAVKGIHPPTRVVGRVKGGGPYGTGRMGP